MTNQDGPTNQPAASPPNQPPPPPPAPPASQAPYAGPDGLWNADITELAAQLFVAVFRGSDADPLPQVGVNTLYDALASLGGFALPADRLAYGSFLNISSEARLPNTQPLGLTIQLAQEIVLLWERASIASRVTGVSVGTSVSLYVVAVLRHGRTVLNAPDPVAALRARLG